jgi:regulatory protein
MLKKMVHSYFLYFCIMVQNLTEAEMSLLAKAERYCANEEQCRTSVRKKLCDWGATPDSSNKIVTRLIDQGFIDERRYARAYVSTKLRHQKWGRLKVIYQLRSKQVPPKFITEALAEITDEEYRNILLDVAETKWTSYTPTEPIAKRRSKLATFLASRGYESPEIQAMLSEHYTGE